MDVMRAIYRRVAEGLALEDGLFIPVGRQTDAVATRKRRETTRCTKSPALMLNSTLSLFAALQFSSRQDRALFNDGRNVGLLLSRDHGQQLHGVPLPKVLFEPLGNERNIAIFFSFFKNQASHVCSFSIPFLTLSLSW